MRVAVAFVGTAGWGIGLSLRCLALEVLEPLAAVASIYEYRYAWLGRRCTHYGDNSKHISSIEVIFKNHYYAYF